MNSANTVSQASLASTFRKLAEEMGLDDKARSLAVAVLDESFNRSKGRINSDSRPKLLLPPGAVSSKEQTVVALKPPPYLAELTENRTAVLNALERKNPTLVEEIQLSRRIEQSKGSKVWYLLRAMLRHDAENALGGLEDYEKVLQTEPNNILVKLAWYSCLARTSGSLREGDVKQITKGRLDLLANPQHRFAVIAKSGLGAPGASSSEFQKEFLAVQSASYVEGKDRCVSALLTVMLFERWFWMTDRDCLYRAKDSARQMLEIWPRDRLAISVLYWLGEGAECSSLSDLDFQRGGPNIYHKSDLGREIVFDYPILMQIPELREVVKSPEFST